jgi:hypothetical protein
MRTVEVYRLARQQLHRLAVLVGNFIVRQVWMKIECGDVCEEAELVKIPKRRKRGNLIRVFGACRTKSPLIMYRHVEPFHQRAGVLPEALLAGHETISMVAVFHLALL